MPRHEPVSPEEDLAAFYEGAPPGVPTNGVVSAPMSEAPVSVVGASAASSAAARSAAAPFDPTASPAWPADGFEPDPSADPAARAPRLAPVQRPPPTFNVPASVVTEAPNPVLAALISVILPGAGQIYAGQTIKGVIILLVAFGTCFGGGVFNVLAAIDALLIAQRKARGEPVGDWQFF